ncbi:guanine nucleotide exchange factor DBS isoform X4 [Folsomia candida]|nr:guanine nucleotide exchange factor DBS isoform X4 [Folsomia candida]
MESGIASQSSSENGGGGGGPSSSHYSVDSVMDLMHQEFALLTGAKSLDDHYILTFPDRGNFHLLGDEDYRRLMIYLTAVPPMHDSESGFVIIVDRRNDKWNSVKTTLVRISNYFPGLIHRVFVLRPVGIFQKALSEISSKLFRTENLRFRLTVCNSMADLFVFVDPSQLTLDLGGLISYDKVKWVQQRVEVEAFHHALQSLSRDLKGFTEVFHDLEYPNNVGSTEVLISDKHSEFQRLRSDLTQAVDHGEHLLFRIKDMCNTPEPDNGMGSSNARKNGGGDIVKNHKGKLGQRSVNSSSVQLINVISVERYIIQIEETARLFEEFWIKEKTSLEQCLQLRRFEHDFREMQATFDIGMKRLEELGEVGESLSATEFLIRDTSEFEASSRDDVSRAQELERIGREIVASNQSAVDSVEPKCYELSRIIAQFQIILEDKMTKQKEWREIQAVIEKANQLCNEGMDLMTCQISDQLTGGEDSTDCRDGGSSCGSALISKIDDFLERIRTMREELSCFKTTPTSPTTSQSKPLVKQVLKRVEDVEVMCIKRKSVIVQQLSKLTKTRRSSGSSFASTPSSGSQTSCYLNNLELKSAKSTSQLDSGMAEDHYSSPTSLRSGSSTLSLDGSSGGYGNNSKHASNRPDGDWELKKIKRGHVLNELLQTERSYVEEIGEILAEYRDQISNPEARSLLPAQLQPIITPTKLQRRNPSVAVLFCNLDEIHAFHAKSFLPDLSNCVESIELVGLCFIQRHSDFLSMYSQYCQLLPASEILRKDIGENHPWFVACRNRLGHKLPLGAYLLKPVQRITKYHLLLKDLIKSSEGCEGYAELLEALECMLVVLRCVNDGMHQLGITGYPGKLIEEGYLLLQGSFLLWTDNKKDRLRLKGHQRHLFLYQRSVLICKKVPKSSLYEFRNKLSLSEVGLTEALKGSGASKKFEIWINGRQKVYLLQAESAETKDIWVREIKKLLLEQLESIRATKSQTIAACAAGMSSSQSLGVSNLQPLAAARRQKMMSGKGITVNGWRTTNIGHRPLRQVSSWDNPDVVPRPKSRISNECDIDEDLWSCSEMSNSDDDDNSTATPPSRPLSIGDESAVAMNVYGVGENVENSPRYVVLADYGPMGPAEVLLKEGDIVSLVKVGCGGWWFVKILHSTASAIGPMEGWAPAAYLEKFNSPGITKRKTGSVTDISGGNVLSVSSKPNQIMMKNKDSNQQGIGGRSASIPTGGSSSSRLCSTSSTSRQKLSQSTEDILSALR